MLARREGTLLGFAKQNQEEHTHVRGSDSLRLPSDRSLFFCKDLRGVVVFALLSLRNLGPPLSLQEVSLFLGLQGLKAGQPRAWRIGQDGEAEGYRAPMRTGYVERLIDAPQALQVGDSVVYLTHMKLQRTYFVLKS